MPTVISTRYCSGRVTMQNTGRPPETHVPRYPEYLTGQHEENYCESTYTECQTGVFHFMQIPKVFIRQKLK